MTQFEIDQLRRQRRSFLKSIVGFEEVQQLRPSQAHTLTRYREEIVRIEGIVAQEGVPFDA